MLPVIVEGDSLAVLMRPALERRLDVRAYDARPGRTVAEGVDRLLARHDLRHRPVLVSLGTNDYFAETPPARIAHDARRLLRRADCVVWSLVRVQRDNEPGDSGAAINRALRSVTRLHLVLPVRPDYGDGVHVSPRNARRLAARFARAARRC